MIICEIGLNHMGNTKYANEYIDKIIKSKADGVLFHIREKSFYKSNSKLWLPDEFYIQSIKKIKKHGLKFGITLADSKKVESCEKLGVDFYKIFSKDILDEKLVKKIILTKKKVFASTGMSNITEIKKFISYIKDNEKNVTLIHTQLDNKIEKVNLKAISLLKNKCKMNVGYGNHASNIFTVYLSIAFDPSDILFYVKGEKFKKHIDDPHAVKLSNLKEFIDNIKELKKAIGKETKIKMKANIK